MLQRVPEAPAIRQLGPAGSEGRQGEQSAGIDSGQQPLQDKDLVRDAVVLHGELEILQQFLSLRREALRSGVPTRADGTRITIGCGERTAAADQLLPRQRVLVPATRCEQRLSLRHTRNTPDHLQIGAQQPEAQRDGAKRSEASGAV